MINPGAAWPNKRWPADRFGAVGRHLWTRHRCPSIVVWGPGEEDLASTVVAAAGPGGAALAPLTSLGDLIALVSAASLVVSGDTGPLHLAAAVGTPIVGLYGPTDPARNGPWSPADIALSRNRSCACHHQRRCTAAVWCLGELGVEDVCAAVDHRRDAAGSGDPLVAAGAAAPGTTGSRPQETER